MWSYLPHPVFANLFSIPIHGTLVVSILHFILSKFLHNFSTQNYFCIQLVYSSSLNFDHILVASIKQGLLDSALRYIQKKGKVNLFKALKNYKVLCWQPLEKVLKEGITFLVYMWLLLLFLQIPHPPSLAPTWQLFSSPYLPSQAAVPFFSPFPNHFSFWKAPYIFKRRLVKPLSPFSFLGMVPQVNTKMPD